MSLLNDCSTVILGTLSVFGNLVEMTDLNKEGMGDRAVHGGARL